MDRRLMMQPRELLPLVRAGARGRRSHALALALALALPRAAHAQDPLAGLDAYIRRAMADWRLAGLAVGVVKDDSLVFAKGYGVREVGRPGAVDENTVFAIGSNTKLFTAVAAGIMVDDGRMKWDDPATKHLPWFRLHDPYATREMTIRDLLAHRSGLGRRGDRIWYGSGFDRAEVIRRIRYLEPSSSFREEYGYQNIMFLTAGEAVGAAAGRSWDDVVRERILRPLGMVRTTLSTNDLPAQENVATPHVWADGQPVPVAWRNLDNAAPAGSINSSVRDMALWLRMLLAGGKFGGKELIEAATLSEVTSPQTLMPFRPDTLNPSTHFSAYGLGIVARDYGGAMAYWHTGGIDGMLSYVGFVPEKKLGVVVLTNQSGHNALFTALGSRILDAYLGLPERDWSTISLEQTRKQEAQAAEQRKKREAERAKGTKPSLPLEEYAGKYNSDLYGEVTVTAEGRRLRVEAGPSFRGPAEHWHYNTFRADWRSPALGRSFVTFRLTTNAEPAALEIEGVGEFKRVPEKK